MTRSTSFTGGFVSVLVFALTALIAVDTACAKAIPFASPQMAKRDVWAPLITSPEESDVWKVGDTVQVTWSTANPPAQVTNSNGMLALRNSNGFVQGAGGLAEPLAGNFSLYDGKIEVQVPDVPARDDYQVVLFGDSGNESPIFTIMNPMLALDIPF
ncbi:hypothetical protein EW145_g2705 [Phellinidium pouzarii]|uniref:Yeast cell wall synthesis Kre9/Knh1-like N-terminal domain-containing protein n=1 Tax=Phellinidium pouzarii TaxID=167371 RepID=A0A4S4LFC9_9AGAM|nr:hypothetical protein EW145_g2705 [Phellinidium pouzarii]